MYTLLWFNKNFIHNLVKYICISYSHIYFIFKLIEKNIWWRQEACAGRHETKRSASDYYNFVLKILKKIYTYIKSSEYIFSHVDDMTTWRVRILKCFFFLKYNFASILFWSNHFLKIFTLYILVYLYYYWAFIHLTVFGFLYANYVLIYFTYKIL